MAKVNASGESIVIEIADPVELERLCSVLKRSKSRKNSALLKAIEHALLDGAVEQEMPAVLAGFEKLLAEQE